MKYGGESRKLIGEKGQRGEEMLRKRREKGRRENGEKEDRRG